jgi:lysozyme family protein
MAFTFESRRGEYAALWTEAVLRPDRAPEARAMARKILATRPRYDAVSRATGVPWYVIGIMHAMECSMSFSKHLHNGDPLAKATVKKPAGRGPFPTWEDSAIDAIRYDNLDRIKDWSVERIAFALEKFNGFGYVGRGIASPYLWSMTTAYDKGKFVEVWNPTKRRYDSKFNPALVSAQVGGMAILKALVELEPNQIDIDGPDQEPAVAAKAEVPLPRPIVVEAVTSKTNQSIGGSMTTGGVAMNDGAVASISTFIDGAFSAVGGGLDAVWETVATFFMGAHEIMPAVQKDVDSALNPITALGKMLSSNVRPILLLMSVAFAVIALARHTRDRREKNHLKAVLPDPAPTTNA